MDLQPVYQQSPGGASDDKHRELAGDLLNLFLAAWFFYIAKYHDLVLSSYVVPALFLLAIYWKHRHRLSGLQQIKLLVFFSFVAGAWLLGERWLLALETQPSRVRQPIEITEATSKELPGSYVGFREAPTEGGPIAVTLRIDEILLHGSGMRFSYSMTEGSRQQDGEGMVYTTTRTLEFGNRSRLRYQKENGKIILWSITGSKLRFTRMDSP